ncbi:MAG: hypothetical protein WD607_11610 [Candidatus Paceibacterota bacterium]
MDPIKIEKLFGRVQSELKKAGSERVELFSIVEFLKALNGRYQEFDTYIIQLFEFFPSIKNPLLFTGIRPDYLSAAIEECKQAIQEIPELKTNEVILEKMDYLHIGLGYINNWLGIKRETDSAHHLQVTEDFSDFNKENTEQDGGSVFVPVVEKNGSDFKAGRLRTLNMEIIGRAKTNEFEIKPVFGIIGTNVNNVGEKAAKAAGKLLRKSIEDSEYWSAAASFELSHTWHAGNSANLALSALFYCEMLKRENKREFFQVNPGIAITGDIDINGRVLEVDNDTLTQKAEAAFFSWIQVLVVPVGQLEQAVEIVDKLESEFPGRHLIIKGIGELRELFYDRRLTLHKQTSLVAHTAKKIWKKRNSTAIGIILIILLGIIGGLVYGPIDKNPVLANYSGEHLIIKNKYESVIKEFFVGRETVEFHEEFKKSHSMVGFFDIDGDGINEVFYSKGVPSGSKVNGRLMAWTVTGDSLIWEIGFDLDTNYPRQHGLQNLGYYAREINISHDGNGVPYIIVLATGWQHFPSALLKLNIYTGEIVETYAHAGQIRDIEMADIDGDGINEIIFTGVNNAYWSAMLGALKIDQMEGHGPFEGDYAIDRYERINEYAYLLIPKTIVGETFNEIQKYNTSEGLHINSDSKTITLTISEVPPITIAGYRRSIVLLYDFDYDFNLTSIATSDQWDIQAKNLFEVGLIPFIPGYEYFDSLRDSVVYWDGTEFEFKMLMNK